MLVHRDDVAGVHERDPPSLAAEGPPHQVGPPDEDDLRLATPRPVQERAPDGLVRGVVAAHGIHRDAHQRAPVTGSRSWASST